VIVKNNGLYLSDKYKEKIEAFEDKETASAKGTINYYQRVHKISKTKSSTIKEKIFSSS
jgi:hypothetical protein